ncbi:hypothetical protein ACOMHN_005081 [Nucella lapillus]
MTQYSTTSQSSGSDEDKIQEAFHSLVGDLGVLGTFLGLEKVRTLGKIVDVLESYGTGSLDGVQCEFGCRLYDLEADPTESQNLAQNLPAVMLFLWKLLGLYKAEEVEPVLSNSYIEDPCFGPYSNGSVVSITWCESDSYALRKYDEN